MTASAPPADSAAIICQLASGVWLVSLAPASLVSTELAPETPASLELSEAHEGQREYCARAGERTKV
jgi:hypothetical protein